MIDNDTANEDRCIAHGAQHIGYHDRLASCVDASEPMGTCEDTSVPHPRDRRDWTHHPTSGSCRSWTPIAPILDEGAREACAECDLPRVTATRCNVHALEQLVYRLEADKSRLATELAEARRELPKCEAHYLGTLIDLRAALTEAVIEGEK